MSKALKITTAALLFIIVVALSGCTVLKEKFETTPQPTATTVAVPSKTPTVAPVASPLPSSNSTVEQQYKYTEKLQSGIDKYNAGVMYMSEAQALAHDHGEWSNASSTMLKAKDRMDSAKADFQTMGNYSINQDEVLLSQKWVQTTDYSSTSLQYASMAYTEMADQIATHGAGSINPVKYNDYVKQANSYNSLAMQSRNEAEAIEKNLTFVLSGL